MQLTHVDFATPAVLDNPLSVHVVANQSNGLQGNVELHRRQVFEQVVGSAAVAQRPLVHQRQLILLGIVINLFDVIDNEVSTGEDAATWRTAHRFGACLRAWRSKLCWFVPDRRT